MQEQAGELGLMPISISMTKRRAKEGEVGLFCDAEIFQEEWSAFKMDSDLRVTATTEAHAKFNRLSWHIARVVNDSTGRFNHNEEARDHILTLCKHVEPVWDHLRTEMKVKIKPTHTLSAEEWSRLIKRMVFYVTTTFGIPEEELSRSAYASQPGPARTEPEPNPEPPQETTEKPRGPQNEAEYVVACKRWLATFTDPAKHHEAREYFASKVHVEMRAALSVKLGVRKSLEREISEHFTRLEKEAKDGGTKT